MAAVNADGGERVLEMGVGTGLALPHYDPRKRVTGHRSVARHAGAGARARVERMGLGHVEALQLGDAENTGLPAASFDVAVAMFVASVVPNPRALLAEMKRVVRPGGLLPVRQPFPGRTGGPAAIGRERAVAGASRTLGWHPDFAIEALLPEKDRMRATRTPVPPLGLFTLVALRREVM